MTILSTYAGVVGEDVVDHLRQLVAPLKGMKVVHVNSTSQGGGVAEILNWLIPLKCGLGLEVRWEVISGNNEFYQCTKQFHNALQGNPAIIADGLDHREKLMEMGNKAREFVRQNFLITRHLREYLTLMVGLMHGAEDRVKLE